MIRVGISGATGLVGESLIRALVGHPRAHLTRLASAHAPGREIAELLPALARELSHKTVPPEPAEFIGETDAVFLASKGPEAIPLARELLKAGIRCIDIGASFRFKDAAVHDAWYEPAHAAPELLAEAVYGLPELHREAIRQARVVGNPGCYPTGAILALAPLLAEKLVRVEGLVVDAHSGLSGAGRQHSERARNLFLECNENARAYAVGTHRHTPEIEGELSRLAGADVRVTFVPHLAPLDRGILTTVYAQAARKLTTELCQEAAWEFYREHPFVRVRPGAEAVELAGVRGTNYCDWGVRALAGTGRVVTVTAIDNTVKGAAGQAVQNMNLMFCFDETAGLVRRSL